MNNSFPCTSCGCCCKRIAQAVANTGNQPLGHPLHFPYAYDSEGCSQLNADNTCKVYHNRPLLCDIKRFGEYLGENEEHFFLINAIICNRLQDEDGIEITKRIVIG